MDFPVQMNDSSQTANSKGADKSVPMRDSENRYSPV